MRKLVLFSMALISISAIEGCTSPNEENEMETVTYNILERNSYSMECGKVVERLYDTIQLYPDVLITTELPVGALNSYNFSNYEWTDVCDERGYRYIDWGVKETVTYYTIWFWYPRDGKNNSKETFTITDNNQIIRTVKATNETTTFNIRSRITDTAKIADRLNSCSKIGFVHYTSFCVDSDGLHPNLDQKGQLFYYNTDKPSVLYEIEGRYDDELMFVCNDEVHRSNKVFVYYFYKKGDDEHLESYTLVPAPIDNE